MLWYILWVCWITYLPCQAVYKCKSSKPSGRMGEVGCNSWVAIKLLYIFPVQWLAVHSIVVLFYKESTSFESWFIIYSFLASRIAEATILHSHKVLKTLYHHLNHMHKSILINWRLYVIILKASVEVWLTLKQYKYCTPNSTKQLIHILTCSSVC